MGTFNNIPVFAHCSSYPIGNLEVGGLQFSFLETVNRENLEKAPAVSFLYFLRPNVDWKPGGEIVKLDLINGSIQIKK